MGNKTLGNEGEQIARRHLESSGMRFVCANYYRRYGEVDIIMEDGAETVFVEVKTRRGFRYGAPAEAVTPTKQKHLRYCAEVYFAEKGQESYRARFDVVEVLLLPGRTPLVHHIKNAF
jgi:putative endonuclease